MFQSAVVRPGTFVILMAVLTLPNLETSSARSVDLSDDIWTSASKRNSWWSKKSVISVPDFQRIIPESPFAENIIETTANSEIRQPYMYVFSCYVKECVPKFTHCVQTSSTQTQGSECEKQHEMCADLCNALRSHDELQ